MVTLLYLCSDKIIVLLNFHRLHFAVGAMIYNYGFQVNTEKYPNQRWIREFRDQTVGFLLKILNLHVHSIFYQCLEHLNYQNVMLTSLLMIQIASYYDIGEQICLRTYLISFDPIWSMSLNLDFTLLVSFFNNFISLWCFIIYQLVETCGCPVFRTE